MQVINARNVNDAFSVGISLIDTITPAGPEPSRNGDVYRAPWPVATVYRQPMERVLWNPVRDANPFFHLFESMWMLAGREDVGWLAQFNKNMVSFSDDGKTFNGAYGFRWRWYFGFDQITSAIHKLSLNINDRRVVLGMWNPHNDLESKSKDVPCNLSVKFTGRVVGGEKVIDMVVFNRSNDIIWGAYGANVVHMSILQEYVCASVGAKVGTYTQVSADWHAYLSTYEPLLAGGVDRVHDHHTYGSAATVTPLFQDDPRSVYDDIEFFINEPQVKRFRNRAFAEVLVPMRDAWFLHKAGKTDEALRRLDDCPDGSDWVVAAHRWLVRRLK
jgi:hypothetical protein